MGRNRSFRGVQGTSGRRRHRSDSRFLPGASEKNPETIRPVGPDGKKFTCTPTITPGYYPGAEPITLKLIFEKETGPRYGSSGYREKGRGKTHRRHSHGPFRKQGTVF